MLAWVNSICALFLAVGLVGLKAPRVIIRPLSEITEAVPVIFTPPDEPPPAQPDAKPDETDQPQDVQTDTPQVVTVVAAADAANVAFSVPVQGAVAIAAAVHLATPPPPVVKAPPKPIQFNPATASGGNFPPPQYPAAALRNHYQGTVTIEITVDAAGSVTAANIQKSSGHSVLDDAALDVVKHRWRFPAGTVRYYYWPCIFQLQ